MYNTFFGLCKSPFNMTPDPRFLYLTNQHRESLAGLSYAVLARKGFVVLTGDAGTGKTPCSRADCSISRRPPYKRASFRTRP